MERLRSILEGVRTFFRYLPYVWMGVRALFALWKARVQQKAVKDALEKERFRRVEAERQLDLRRALGGSFADRRDRALRDAVAREISRRSGDGHDDNDPQG